MPRSIFSRVSKPIFVVFIIASMAIGVLASGHNVAKAATVSANQYSNPAAIDPIRGHINSVSCSSSSQCIAVDNYGYETTYNGSSWSIPTNISSQALSGISCLSSTFCMAVSGNSSFKWNGTSWIAYNSIDSTSNITSISCVSTSLCWAADFSGNVTQWNGTSWSSLINIDSYGFGFVDVSCVSSTFCMALDFSGNESTWNGSSWSSLLTADSTGGVSSGLWCSSSTFCVTIDYDGNYAIFNGSSWSTPSNLDSNSLNSVTCSSPSYCIASDNSGNNFSYNGSTWSSATDIDSSTPLDTSSCTSSSFCVAVDGKGDALTWNGTTWSLPIPIDNTPTLNSISCVSTSFCISVDSIGNEITWNGFSWSAITNIDSNNDMKSISCTSSSFCMVIDSAGNALKFDGSTWSSSSTGITPSAISCSSSSFCVAVGNGGSESTWNGTSWIVSNIDGSNVIYSISCFSSTFCVAGDLEGNVILYSGSSWSAASNIDGTNFIESISCSSSSFCFAVDNTGNELQGNGSSWSAASNIDGSNYLHDVSCVTSSFCQAVDLNGNYLNWNGSSWSQPVDFDNGSGITGLSCVSSTFCMSNDELGNAFIYPVSAVTSISPDSGSLSGGQVVNIYGIGFTGATNVQFGSNSASFSVINDNTISATVPSSTASGVVSVTVTTSNGVSRKLNSSGYLYVSTGQFVSVTPTRICDTRVGATDPGTYANSTLSAGTYLNINVVDANNDGVPASASVIVLNVTAVQPSATGWLSIWPAGTAQPANVSVVSYTSGQSAFANLEQVPIGENGYISIANSSGTTDVVVDVVGYYAYTTTSSAGLYNPLSSPQRLADTRSGSGYQDAGQTLSPNSSISVQITGNAGIPTSGVMAVVGNITVTNTTSNGGFLMVYPYGSSTPNTSTLNWDNATTICNRAIVGLGTNGAITLTNGPNGDADVIVDIEGWFTNSSSNSGYQFHPVSPFRLVDTRSGSGYQDAGQTLAAGGSLTISASGNNEVPTSAISIFGNFTVTNTTANGGYISEYAYGTSLPATADLNWNMGETISNVGLVDLSTSGKLTVTAQVSGTDVILDIFGWYG